MTPSPTQDHPREDLLARDEGGLPDGVRREQGGAVQDGVHDGRRRGVQHRHGRAVHDRDGVRVPGGPAGGEDRSQL